MQGGGGYIIGEKLRSGTPEVKAALSRQGRYKTVRDNLQVKEVRLGDDTDRFIICYNPDQAERDAAIRAAPGRPAGRAHRRHRQPSAPPSAAGSRAPWPPGPA